MGAAVFKFVVEAVADGCVEGKYEVGVDSYVERRVKRLGGHQVAKDERIGHQLKKC